MNSALQAAPCSIVTLLTVAPPASLGERRLQSARCESRLERRAVLDDGELGGDRRIREVEQHRVGVCYLGRRGGRGRQVVGGAPVVVVVGVLEEPQAASTRAMSSVMAPVATTGVSHELVNRAAGRGPALMRRLSGRVRLRASAAEPMAVGWSARDESTDRGMPHLEPPCAFGRRAVVSGRRSPVRCGAVSISTKRGDDGTTGLLYGGRVRKKSSLRIETNGAIDEAQAALGLARAEVRGLGARRRAGGARAGALGADG